MGSGLDVGECMTSIINVFHASTIRPGPLSSNRKTEKIELLSPNYSNDICCLKCSPAQQPGKILHLWYPRAIYSAILAWSTTGTNYHVPTRAYTKENTFCRCVQAFLALRWNHSMLRDSVEHKRVRLYQQLHFSAVLSINTPPENERRLPLT